MIRRTPGTYAGCSYAEHSLCMQADDRLLMVTDGNDALSPALPHPSARLPGAALQAHRPLGSVMCACLRPIWPPTGLSRMQLLAAMAWT